MTETPRNSPIDKAADHSPPAADRVAAKATDAITSARASLHDTVDTVAERANAATKWASDRVGAARQAPIDVIEAGAEYIKARPYAAVAGALAVGYVMGRLGRRA